MGEFELEDVWELPGEGTRGEFGKLVELICAMDPGERGSVVSRALWAVRWKVGELLGWDEEEGGLGARVESVGRRLPEDLRDTDPPAFARLPFVSLYITEDEFAAEAANETMHGVMHLGAVPSPTDPERIRVRMAVLVKPNGLKGKAYMLAIRPFRHLIVYPAMMRQGRRMWERVAA
ncbi:MAG TPA: DUF2867 domain-containing protein [Baekduia sp.]|uniref:DUF2867 domain-containing protein n=1 Tax=Baekduia sp. TaxID=2600305 RepID=UPI002D773A44|nr:DUF2867 domain-containing protein [Baekduia sp.]HET6508922.1 DUF2867 domain-containing protein [Baekduia sp.]